MTGKVGDNVRILAGKDKGKEGKVIKTFKLQNRVAVEGINIVKKHAKPRTTEEQGGIIEVEAPIHVSNVKVIGDTKVKEAKTKEVKADKKTTTKKTATKKESK